jgi:hypothetical protein
MKDIIKMYKIFENELILYISYKNDLKTLNSLILIKNIKYNANIKLFDKLPIFPEFPLKFSDLPEHTKYASKKLKKCEKWWVENNFSKSLEDCLKYVASISDF